MTGHFSSQKTRPQVPYKLEFVYKILEQKLFIFLEIVGEKYQNIIQETLRGSDVNLQGFNLKFNFEYFWVTLDDL